MLHSLFCPVIPCAARRRDNPAGMISLSEILD
jgi:hypothetical protein